jgi:membrane protease YdiL (CAAX protease family)
MFDVAVAYAASLIIASWIASGSSHFLAYALYAHPSGNDFDWTNYVVSWGIEPSVFAGLLAAIGVGRGYTVDALWSPLPHWSWFTWGVLAVVYLAWALFEAVLLGTFFKEELHRDTEVFEYVLSTPLAGFLVIMMVVIAPISEEFVFRKILLDPLARSRLGFRGAAYLTSLVRAVIHFYSLPLTIFVFASGVAFCYLARSAKSIWPGVAAHAILNAYAAAVMLFNAQSPA